MHALFYRHVSAVAINSNQNAFASAPGFPSFVFNEVFPLFHSTVGIFFNKIEKGVFYYENEHNTLQKFCHFWDAVFKLNYCAVNKFKFLKFTSTGKAIQLLIDIIYWEFLCLYFLLYPARYWTKYDGKNYNFDRNGGCCLAPYKPFSWIVIWFWMMFFIQGRKWLL